MDMLKKSFRVKPERHIPTRVISMRVTEAERKVLLKYFGSLSRIRDVALELAQKDGMYVAFPKSPP